MKRFISALMIGALLVLSFTGCDKKGTCDLCGEEDVKVKEITIGGENIEGEKLKEKLKICEECEKDLNEGF